MDIKIALLFLCLCPLYCVSVSIELLTDDVDGTKQVKVKHVGETVRGKAVNIKEVHGEEVHGKEVHGKEVHGKEVHKSYVKPRTENSQANSTRRVRIYLKVHKDKTNLVTPKKILEETVTAKPSAKIGDSAKGKREAHRKRKSKKTPGKRRKGIQQKNKIILVHLLTFLNWLQNEIGRSVKKPKHSGQRRLMPGQLVGHDKKAKHTSESLSKQAPTKVHKKENVKSKKGVGMEEKHPTKKPTHSHKTTPKAE